MRKIVRATLLWLLLAGSLSLTQDVLSQVPAFGPETFGTTAVLPTGWTVIDGGNDKNTWEMINTVFPSVGYSSPNASGGSHIKIDATASRFDFLSSPTIDFSNYTHGILKFGLWRIRDYNEFLYISIDNDNDGSFDDYTRTINPADSLKEDTWGVITIDLGSLIDKKPIIRFQIRQSNFYTTSGPLRIDDFTLYGFTSTLPSDHFRTKASGEWDNATIWESSHDNVNWMSATLTPTYLANTITIRSTHSVTNTTPLTVDQLTINNGGKLSFAHDLSLNNGTGTDLQLEEDGILDFSNFRLINAGTVELNGIAKTSNPEGFYGSSVSSIAAGVTLNPLGLNSIVEYNAAGNQYITALPNYSTLIISGSGDKILKGPTTVTDNLLLNGGFLLLDEHDLIVGNSATGSSSSYIKINRSGKLTINNINGAGKNFPIGNRSYNPLTISNGSNLAWTAGIEDGWNISDPGLSAQKDKAVLRTWTIIPSTNPPAGTANILFQYDDADTDQVGSEFDKEAPIQIWRKADNNWLAAGVTQTPSGSTNGIRTVALEQESLFTQFAISNMDTPLPVRFKDVRALQKQNTVSIYFTNQTEGGLLDYKIERSADGQGYSTIKEIKPLRNNGTAASYEETDNTPLENIGLYRIKATGRSGKVTYSPIVRVNKRESSPRIVIVPNPVDKGEVSLQLSNVTQDNFRMYLYNAKGQLLHQQQLQHAGGSATYPLNIERLLPGTYLIELTGKEKLQQRFVMM